MYAHHDAMQVPDGPNRRALHAAMQAIRCKTEHALDAALHVYKLEALGPRRASPRPASPRRAVPPLPSPRYCRYGRPRALERPPERGARVCSGQRGDCQRRAPRTHVRQSTVPVWLEN